MNSTCHTFSIIPHSIPWESKTSNECSLIIPIPDIQDIAFLSTIGKSPRYRYCTGQSCITINWYQPGSLCTIRNPSESLHELASRGTWQFVRTDFYKRPDGQVIQEVSCKCKSTSQGWLVIRRCNGGHTPSLLWSQQTLAYPSSPCTW